MQKKDVCMPRLPCHNEVQTERRKRRGKATKDEFVKLASQRVFTRRELSKLISMRYHRVLKNLTAIQKRLLRHIRPQDVKRVLYARYAMPGDSVFVLGSKYEVEKAKERYSFGSSSCSSPSQSQPPPQSRPNRMTLTSPRRPLELFDNEGVKAWPVVS